MALTFNVEALAIDGATARRMIATDLAGRRGLIVLRGFNMSGHCKLDGLPCRSTTVADALFSTLAADGFNLIRLPVVYERRDADVDRRLVEIVDLAAKHGLYVLVDLHQDLLGSAFRDASRPEYHGTGFPVHILQAAYASTQPDAPWRDATWDAPLTWQQNYRNNAQLQQCLKGLAHVVEVVDLAREIAALIAGRPHVIGYEVINEPMRPLTGALYHEYFNNIAAALPDGAAIAMPRGDWLYHDGIPTFVDNIAEIDAGFDPAALSNLQLSTPHIYDPLEMASPLAPSPAEYVIDLVAQWHRIRDLPFIIGEFGVPATLVDAAGHLRTWVSRFEQRGISWCLWNLNPEADGNGDDHWCGEHMSVATRGPGDSTNLTVRYRTLLRPFVVLASGAVSGMTYEASDWCFRVTVGRAPAPGLTTKIVVPPSLGDFDVTDFEGGTSFRKEGNIVTFSTNDAPVSIELTRHAEP